MQLFIVLNFLETPLFFLYYSVGHPTCSHDLRRNPFEQDLANFLYVLVQRAPQKYTIVRYTWVQHCLFPLELTWNLCKECVHCSAAGNHTIVSNIIPVVKMYFEGNNASLYTCISSALASSSTG